MDAMIKKTWVTALRSGAWPQGRGTLYNQDNRSYCCLGVLYEAITGVTPIKCSDEQYSEVANLLGDINNRDISYQVMDMNDDKKMSFNAIADWVETNL